MKKYWKSLDEINKSDQNITENKENSESQPLLNLFEEELSGISSSRRDFLKLFGFSVTAAALASSCENPVKKAIPFLNKPEEIVPGKANYYASTYFDGSDYCSILVKNRDGRPIKIEGNKLSPISMGGTNAKTQASVLSLYDGKGRIRHPLKDKHETQWDIQDTEIRKVLKNITEKGNKTVILSSNMISPTTRKLFIEFTESYPGSEVIYYDPVSVSSIQKANKECFGNEVIPSCHFDQADIIVGFSADFLGTWLSPVEYARQYASTRKLSKEKKSLSKHIQFETGMTITGASADQRIPVKPSEEALIIVNLYNNIAKASGNKTLNTTESPVDISSIAKELLDKKGKALVVCGSNNVSIQLLVNAINHMLNSYGKTIDFTTPLYTKGGADYDLEDLIAEMNNGKVKGLIFNNVNPVYDYYGSDDLVDAMRKMDLTVSFSSIKDETSDKCFYICPDNHFLESWNDAEPKKGQYSLVQPVINRIFNTRQMQDSLLSWMEKPANFHQYLKDYWQVNLFNQQQEYLIFEDFWNYTLQKGVFDISIDAASQPDFNNASINNSIVKEINGKKTDGIELQLYESVALGNGKHANNPWLQELPDPVSKVCWDNYAAVSPKYADENSLKNGSIISINDKLELPVLIQPGQAYESISVALGYGRTISGSVGEKVGGNAYNLIEKKKGYQDYILNDVQIKKTGKSTELALSQEHHSMEGRPIVRETTLKEYKENPAAGNEMHKEIEKHHTTLYKEKNLPGHHWGMAVDLNSCTGCSTCVIACQAENNIAVVGKEEVRKRRIMHWIRLDRYYSKEAENPEVVFQPIMCQHCDNAPCENVCPVAATLHSDEGINQMAYNRCVGTKYCINNCPYKVRRFNWFRYVTNKKFDYNMNEDIGRMVLNPDVTVRERGVVEKCSFCIQRIQEKKLQAKIENRPLEDGEIQPACVQSCPSKALVFGDLNDPDSEITQCFKDERNYHLLEELHSLPSVGYMTKIRNNKNEKGE
ncbi:TAT-variant-translocated molybdopterin oxidoreductase [candidate division KSB1 bacterium]